MTLITTGLLFTFALLLMIKGGDYFVDAACALAEQTGIPKLIVGATVVSLATTMPELLVSVTATLKGLNGIAIGNVIGSAAFNTGVILGLSITVLPAVMRRSAFLDKGLLMLGSTIVLMLFAKDRLLSISEALVLFCLLAIFFYLNINSAVEQGRQNPQRPAPWTLGEALLTLMKFAGGALAIVFGARMLVDNGEVLARALKVPESIIGLTLVAAGTSLPELVTTISALAKKEPALSIGNIIGANTIDITLILSSCGLISGRGLAMEQRAYLIDLPVTLLLMGIAILPPALTGKFQRWQGIALLLVYGGYLRYITLLS